jgi:hypothetical protein
MAQVVTGLFETRREAEIAVERLVQEHGMDRRRIQAFAEGGENSAGTRVSGADAEDARQGAPVEGQRAGAIRVLAEVEEAAVGTAIAALREAGAAEAALRGDPG